MPLPSQGYYSKNRFGRSASTQRVWNPGHYVSFQSWMTDLTSGALNATADAVYAILGAKPAVKGVSITVLWSDLETSYGVYDDSVIDAHLARCVTEGLQLCVRASHKTFANSDHAVPAYMQAGINDAVYGNDDGAGTGSSSGGEYKMSDGGYVAKMNIPAVYERYVAWLNHLSARYGSNPNFEMIYFNESAQGTPVNYTLTSTITTNFFANLTLVCAAAKLTAPHKVVARLFNFPPSALPSIYASSISDGIGIGYADVFTSTVIGETSNVDPVNHNIALAGGAAAFSSPNNFARCYTYSADARGKIPIISIVSPDSWDHDRAHQTTPVTYIKPATATELYNWCRDQLFTTHIFWTYVNAIPAAYNVATPYSYRDLVLSGGVVYQSKTAGTGTNTGNDVSNTTYWENLGDTFPAIDKQFYPLMDTLAGLTAGGLNAAYPDRL